MISIKIKNLHIHLRLGFWPSVHPQEGVGVRCCLVTYFKKAKGITEAFSELAGRSGTRNQGLTHVISLEKVEFGH